MDLIPCTPSYLNNIRGMGRRAASLPVSLSSSWGGDDYRLPLNNNNNNIIPNQDS